MSGNALRDLNTLPTPERKNDSSSKGNFSKPCNGKTIDNVEERLKKSLSSVQINGGETLNVQHNKSSASVQINGGETVNVGVEVANSEVEYIESENLSDLEDVDTCLKKLLHGLDFKDWILVVETLNNVRRLSVFHKERMHSMLYASL